MVDHLASHQQGQRVKQLVDGEAGLVDGHDDGPSLIGHSAKDITKIRHCHVMSYFKHAADAFLKRDLQ